jgi:hypothetical protein
VPVVIRRDGPGYVAIEFDTSPTIDRADLATVAQSIIDKLAVFEGEAFRDFGLSALVYTPEESHQHDGSNGAGILCVPDANDPLVIPFAQSHDHDDREMARLRSLLARPEALKRKLVEHHGHMVGADTPVDAFMSAYAVLEMLCGPKQSDIDNLILRVMPSAETSFDDREQRDVTIYTRLRNAKGHATSVPPQHVSPLMAQHLPQLLDLARSALLESVEQSGD